MMEKIKNFFGNINNIININNIDDRVFRFLDKNLSLSTILIIGFLIAVLMFLFQVGVIGTIIIIILNNVFNVPTAYSLVNYGYAALAIFAVFLIKGR